MRVVFEVVLRVVLRLFEGCCLRVGFEKNREAAIGLR